MKCLSKFQRTELSRNDSRSNWVFSYITDNQERGPAFMMQQVKSNFAVPGVGYFKTFKTTGVDYFDARGTIHFTAAKYLDFSFGYDKNFIGNGYRSLFLSDFSNSYLFLKINTRIWKLNYQNIFMELLPQFVQTNDELRDKKYAAVHHLSINATRWLNLGLFESVVFGRVNHFEFSYLNPIMFLRSLSIRMEVLIMQSLDLTQKPISQRHCSFTHNNH